MLILFGSLINHMVKAIEIKNFRKSFGDNIVIKDLNFDVNAGEVFAFLGANGSGKTTTIRALLGILKPDSGTLQVFSKNYNPSMSNMLGYLPEERGMYVNGKVIDTMIYLGQLKGMTARDAKQSALKYLERVELSDKANNRVKQLSSGQQQKIQLGITVINNPTLLILDEPTKGLDPLNRNLMLDIFLELNRSQGSTILFSTHQMDEAEKIAERLIMIKNGDKALYGSVDEIRKSFGNNIIHLRFTGKFPYDEKLYTADVEANYAEITPGKGISTDQILRKLVNSDIIMHEFQIGSPSLNDIFIKVSNNE